MIGGILVGSSIKSAFQVGLMQHEHYLAIMLPGFITGAMIGFLTQRMGAPVAVRARG
jgi:hypothetical protein